MLKWVFGADVGPFKRGLSEMRGEVKAFSGSAKGMIAGALGGGAVLSWVKQMSDKFIQIQRTGQRFGMTADSVQRIGHAAESVGADLETMGDAFNDLREHIADAENGSQDYIDALGTLGISIKEFKKLKPEEQLMAISKGYMNASDKGQALLAINDLLGGAGEKLMPLLTQGPQKLVELFGEAQVAGKGAVDTIANLNRQILRIKEFAVPIFAGIINFFLVAKDAIGSMFEDLAGQVSIFGTHAGPVFDKLGESIKAALSGNVDEAKRKWNEMMGISAKMRDAMAEHHTFTRDRHIERRDAILNPQGPATTPGANGSPALKALKERKKLEEEILKLQEEARINQLNLEEKITDAIARREKLAEAYLIAENLNDELQAKRDMLQLDKEIAKLRGEQAAEQKKLFDAETQAQERLLDVQQREAEMRHQMDLDGMSDVDRFKALKADKSASDKLAADLEAKGDKQGASEERQKGLDIQREINAMRRDAEGDLADLMKQGPSIATSSLQSIGAGGSVSVFSSDNTQRQIVDYLRIIAENSKSEGGTTTKPQERI